VGINPVGAMGQALPRPVLSTIVERKALNGGFRVGVAEMNGWRNKMEDAHVIHLRDDWAFLGVFDGHGGEKCSEFVAKEFYKRLEADGKPADDATLKALVLDVDQCFMDSGTGGVPPPSGSTGAMCIVERLGAGGKLRLRVANVGDSRVFIGRPDGSIVDGGGTEQGHTTDHKPSHPSEKERIYRCGGTVEMAEGGVARVNGDLAVSRAFGDAQYKKTGGPGPEDRPVTADPELETFEVDETDILIIACDGVSEGDFPNQEVVKLVAEKMRDGGFAGGVGDPGIAAHEVILKAEKQNSKDNITCMIVTFNGALETIEGSIEYLPDELPFKDNRLVAPYEVMAKRAGRTLAQAVELRYDNVNKELAKEDLDDVQREAFKSEVAGIEVEGAEGSPERTACFEKWIETQQSNRPAGGGHESLPAGMGMEDLMRMIQSQQAGQQGQGEDDKGTGVRVKVSPDLETLKADVEKSANLKWDDKMADLLDAEGEEMQTDPSDNTIKVKFEKKGMTAWLPSSCVAILGKGNAAEGYGAGESAAAAPAAQAEADL